jgi:16S rRNA (adenine1518-N6/adenine1519-N6)-dimethyltransferase
VLNRNGDLWLQKRSLRKDKNHGLWDSSVSGHLDAGEDYATAALRELGEEIGIDSMNSGSLTELAVLKPCEQTGWEHVRLFLTEHAGPVHYPAAEIESMMPFPIAEIEAWASNRPQDFSPVFLIMFRKWRSGNDGN